MIQAIKARWKEALLFLWFGLLYVFMNRYHFIAGPQKLFVMKILQVQNPALFSADQLERLTLGAYYTLFAWPLAWLAHAVDLRWIFLIGHGVTTVLYLYASFRLSSVLFASRFAALLGVLALFVIKPIFLDASLYPTIFYHRNVALALQLFALERFMRKKFLAASILLGTSFNISGYSAFHLGVMFLGAAAAGWRPANRRLTFQCMLAFVVSILPTVLWRLKTGSDTPIAIPTQEWLGYLKRYAPGYVFGSYLWKPEAGTFTTFLMMLVWPLYFLAPFARKMVSAKQNLHRAVLGMAAAALILFMSGIVFSDVLPIGFIMQMMVFRVHRFFALLAILYFAFYLYRRIGEEQDAGRLWLVFMASAFLCSKMILTSFMLGLDLFLCLVLSRSKQTVPTVLSVAIVILSLIPSDQLPPVIERFFHLNITFLMVSLLVWLWAYRRLAAAIFAMLFVLVLTPANQWRQQIEWPWARPIPPAYPELFEWVREHTPPSAVLMTPVYEPVLSAHFPEATRRSQVLADDSLMVILSLGYAREWGRRAADFGLFPRETYLERYQALSAETIKELDAKYPFQYFVTFRDSRPLSFPLVYQNDRFLVYQTGPKEHR